MLNSPRGPSSCVPPPILLRLVEIHTTYLHRGVTEKMALDVEDWLGNFTAQMSGLPVAKVRVQYGCDRNLHMN